MAATFAAILTSIRASQMVALRAPALYKGQRSGAAESGKLKKLHNLDDYRKGTGAPTRSRALTAV